jgi:hypothetical protein
MSQRPSASTVGKRKEDAVYETYRLLGREHEADLEREAARRNLAAAARVKPSNGGQDHSERQRKRRVALVRSRLAAMLR